MITPNEAKNILSNYIDSPLLKGTWKNINEFDKQFIKNSTENIKYEGNDYIVSMLNCFRNYSRGYVLRTKENIGMAKSILDFGAGIGFSTILLSQLYPNSEIFYYDTSHDSKKIFKKIITDYSFNNITIVDKINLIEPELICCFEVIEHIKNPYKFMGEIFSFNSTYLSLTASFGTPGYGHFNKYFDYEEIDRHQMSKYFWKWIKKSGYSEIKTDYFNHRPRLFKRNRGN